MTLCRRQSQEYGRLLFGQARVHSSGGRRPQLSGWRVDRDSHPPAAADLAAENLSRGRGDGRQSSTRTRACKAGRC